MSALTDRIYRDWLFRQGRSETIVAQRYKPVKLIIPSKSDTVTQSILQKKSQ